LLGQARRSAALGDEAIEAMVSERGEAKKARDFQRADRLRDELGKAGIVLEDSAQGTRWRRQ
jgi:cysteinyl-tRNA synthetase